MIKYIRPLFGVIIFLIFQSALFAQSETLENDEIAVFYESSLSSVAAEIVRVYPLLRQELEELFRWRLPARPQVILIKKSESFQRIARNKLFVALAVPKKNLIIIDNSRVNILPFTLHVTLKHELCHLLLHHHINDNNLTKWLDEGICQWASDGLGEIFIEKNWSGLDAAILAGREFQLDQLTNKFPQEDALLMLAYEQSKSVVVYIDRHYSKSALLNILGYLKNGVAIDAAIQKSLDLSIDQLQEEWRNHLKGTPRWLLYLANNIYAILFFLAALLVVVGFIRQLMRKRAWQNEQEEEH